MLTMTCQSLLLIRVLNELCLLLCTLESVSQLPRQLQFIWLRARETALPYFSDSSALLKVEDTSCLKKGSILFHFTLFYIPYCRLVWSYYLCRIKAPEKMYFFSKRSLSSRKETPKNIRLCICADGVMSLRFNTTQY